MDGGVTAENRGQSWAGGRKTVMLILDGKGLRCLRDFFPILFY